LKGDPIQFLSASREENTQKTYCWIKKATMVILLKE